MPEGLWRDSTTHWPKFQGHDAKLTDDLHQPSDLSHGLRAAHRNDTRLPGVTGNDAASLGRCHALPEQPEWVQQSDAR